MQKIDSKKRKTFKKIVRLIIKNSQEGLKLFYDEYGKMIYMTAKSVGCKHEQAEAVVNAVMSKVWRKRDDLFEIENPEGWIYVVAKNCAKDEINEVWCLELNDKICKAEDSFEEIDSNDNFERLISVLKFEERELITIRFVRGNSFQEIANMLEKPLATVTSTYYRALEKIKKFIKDKNYE